MNKKLLGLVLVGFSILALLLVGLGLLGMTVREDAGNVGVAVVFGVLGGLGMWTLAIGLRLSRKRVPAPESPPPAMPDGERAEAIPPPAPADVFPGEGSAPPEREQSPLSPTGVFPRQAPSVPYEPVYDACSERLINALLALNRNDLPFRIIDGRPEGVDLIAEWKLVDAEYHALFARAGVKRVFRIFMKLDPASRTVRAKDQEYGVRWSNGVPTVLAGSYFQGQKWTLRSHGEIALRKDTRKPGVVVNHSFSTAEIKNPIKSAIKEAGWRYKGVAFRSL